MANQWFKFYGGEYLSDPKIERLTPIERSCWITILCMASMGDDGVIEFLTVESLLNRSGIYFDPYHPEDWEKALGVLLKFSNLKMIDTDTDGKITVKNWAKRQESYLTDAERAKNYRDRKKNRHENVTPHVTNVTLEENRIEENRVNTDNGTFQTTKKGKVKKQIFGEFEKVLLTEEEHSKLVERMGEKNTNILIAELDGYLASKNKKYSSHYATILNWARRRVLDIQNSKVKTI